MHPTKQGIERPVAHAPRRPGALATVAAMLVPAVFCAAPAQAIPAFAKIYHKSCSSCHTHIPQLTEFGRTFLRNNFRVPGEEKDAPLALRRNLPLSIELVAHAANDSRAEDPDPKLDGNLDAVLLQGGGLLTKKDAFYLHHHLLEDNRPGDVYEIWVQHAFDDRNNLNLRVGQYEQPLGLSSDITRLTHAGYLSYEAGVGQNDFSFSSPVRGIMLSGGSLGDGLRFALSYHAPQERETAHGEPEMEEMEGVTLTRQLNTVLLRLEQQIRDNRFGIFGTMGSTRIATPDGTSKDHYSRFGVDVEAPFRIARVYGTWMTGENSNPTVGGGRGSLTGGFIGAEFPLAHSSGEHSGHTPYAAYLQYDRVHVRSPLEEGVSEGPTVGFLMHPVQYLAIIAEYQHRRENRDRFVLAGHVSF